jgi:hypothetical protein
MISTTDVVSAWVSVAAVAAHVTVFATARTALTVQTAAIMATIIANANNTLMLITPI